ncbi:MAG TPA: hypothetical protein VEQ60_12235 [Longimicrobium sp.]|nr:hypothetical protein [Longimicrobium sp.]
MSGSEIERLIEERSLIRENYTDTQVVGFWDKAAGSLESARFAGMPAENAYQLAYTAALQISLAVLAAHGLRVKSTSNHYLTFHVVQRLDPTLDAPGRRLDGLRHLRHQTIYEPEHDEGELARRLSEAFDRLREALPLFRKAILAVRPHLASFLRVIQS